MIPKPQLKTAYYEYWACDNNDHRHRLKRTAAACIHIRHKEPKIRDCYKATMALPTFVAFSPTLTPGLRINPSATKWAFLRRAFAKLQAWRAVSAPGV